MGEVTDGPKSILDRVGDGDENVSAADATANNSVSFKHLIRNS